MKIMQHFLAEFGVWWGGGAGGAGAEECCDREIESDIIYQSYQSSYNNGITLVIYFE